VIRVSYVLMHRKSRGFGLGLMSATIRVFSENIQATVFPFDAVDARSLSDRLHSSARSVLPLVNS